MTVVALRRIAPPIFLYHALTMAGFALLACVGMMLIAQMSPRLSVNLIDVAVRFPMIVNSALLPTHEKSMAEANELNERLRSDRTSSPVGELPSAPTIAEAYEDVVDRISLVISADEPSSLIKPGCRQSMCVQYNLERLSYLLHDQLHQVSLASRPPPHITL